ncbi:MAG: AAA family ATPase [Nitrospira sp.]
MKIPQGFEHAIKQAGLVPPAVIPPGKITRFPGIGKSNGNKSGWAWIAEDAIGGAFGDWSSGLSETWHAAHGSTMTAAAREAQKRRIAAAQRVRHEEETKAHAEAAQRAQTIWSQAAPAPAAHPYLLKKQVQAHGLRVNAENHLIVPVLIDGTITSLQTIDENGTKKFLAGGAIKGGSCSLGNLIGAMTILLCEGVATGGSLHEATGDPVIVAFSANNLTLVAEQLRRQHPTAKILVCADADSSGTGQREARKAADAVGGIVALPDEPGLDFNDVHVRHGVNAVRTAIEAALARKEALSKGPSDLSTAMLSYSDLLSLEIPERPRYLSWLPEGGNVMAYGPRGVGKTFFQLAIATSLTTGKPLWKWACTRPVGVLYVDGEMQLDELRQRTTALMNTPPIAPLEFLTGQLVYQRCGGKDLILTSDHMRQEVVKLLDARPEIRVMILDNISCLFSGINEDSKQDWEPINAWLIRLRHRGLATILVHHAGKGGQQRGTSGREDSLDTVIQLARPTGGDARDGCHFELSFTKCRSVTGDDVGPLDVRLQMVNERLQWSWQLLEMSTLEKARKLVAEGVNGPTELGEELGIHKGYASRILKKLRAEVGV